MVALSSGAHIQARDAPLAGWRLVLVQGALASRNPSLGQRHPTSESQSRQRRTVSESPQVPGSWWKELVKEGLAVPPGGAPGPVQSPREAAACWPPFPEGWCCCPAGRPVLRATWPALTRHHPRTVQARLVGAGGQPDSGDPRGDPPAAPPYMGLGRRQAGLGRRERGPPVSAHGPEDAGTEPLGTDVFWGNEPASVAP